MSSEQKSFESALNDLKLTISKLESGDLSLEESLSHFEDGIKLISFCQNKLEEVQKKVEILTENDQGEVLRNEFNLEEKGK